MNHRGVLVRIVAGLALMLTAGAAADDRPNVVLIVGDDLGGSDLGCYGSKFHRTPNLDKLAAGGRRFTQAYAASPVCSPTRVALMTGVHPARVGLTDWLPGRGDRPDQRLLTPPLPARLPAEIPTIAEALRAAGYATAHVGKWHLGGVGAGPSERGFGLNVGGDAAGTPLSYFAPFRRGSRSMPGLGDAPDGQYLTDRLTDEALKFVEANRSAPFFLYMPHYAVHTPMAGKPDLVAGFPKWDGTPHGRQENPIYAAMLQSFDESVGRVVARLDELGLREKTLILVTGDNGGLATREGPNTPATSNAPFREGKGYLYEGGLRVPLIVSRPGWVKAGVDESPVWAADLPTTIGAVCGVPKPFGIDGVDLASCFESGTPPAARTIYWHYPHYSNQGGKPAAALRDGDWKLVVDDETGRGELFNLKDDPRESTNLSDKFPGKTGQLTLKLDAWRGGVGAKPAVVKPDFVPSPQAADGRVVLHARTAEVHGVMLRFEPLPHKNTLGYWVRADDWASWDFTVKTAGAFDVSALIGCGNGSGGSKVSFRVGAQSLDHQVVETGGFQNFVRRDLGRLTFDAPGRYRMEVRAGAKPGPAVMDLREVVLTPAVGG